MTTGQKIFGVTTIGLAVGAAFVLGRSRRRGEANERDLRRFFGEASSTDELVDSFVVYLKREAPSNLKAFESLRRENPESARAEAVVFGLLQQLRLRPVIADVVGVGGADFLCTHPSLNCYRWVLARTLMQGAHPEDSGSTGECAGILNRSCSHGFVIFVRHINSISWQLSVARRRDCHDRRPIQ
jgi:hypothetical protein